MSRNGKGSAPRSNENYDSYGNSWDRIFGGSFSSKCEDEKTGGSGSSDGNENSVEDKKTTRLQDREGSTT